MAAPLYQCAGVGINQKLCGSTYKDLHEERKAVTWALLSARHIPVGMESFTATDDRGWQTIKSAIDQSDYYVLIVGGLYGSVDAEGKSWTEREYDYARQLNIPVFAFIRRKTNIASDATETNTRMRSRIEAFRKRLKVSHLCAEWTTAEKLSELVATALHNHIREYEGTPNERPGWYRGDALPRTKEA
jgi:Domain of unknown function (DUF4062)